MHFSAAGWHKTRQSRLQKMTSLSAWRLCPLEEFEDTLAIEKIVRAGTERYWLELESMIFRLAARLECDPKQLELPRQSENIMQCLPTVT